MTIELINQYDEKRTVYPLDRDILIPHPFNLNDTLQHLDGQINCAIPYDPEIHKFLVENSFLKSKVYNEETQTIFTGVVKDGLEWIDNGTPEPLNEISLTLQDNSYYLNNTPEEDITYINQSLTTILADICKRCNLQIGSNLPTDTISVAQIKQNTTYLNFINDILFQYCYAFGFDANGVLQTINIKEMETSEVFDDFFTGLKFTKTTKNYNAIHLKYGELTVKQNEQVYYEGGEISSDNTIQPIIIQPNAYYPPEATPIIEEQDGKVIQNFSDGFAQAVTLFNGEKKYQRSKNTELIYTEDHVVTKDYSDNLTLDRTDFTATSASVRFYNNSATDAELYQLAIRATAYYRRPKKLILGEGKKFEYEAIYIYDSQRASTFANFLAKYFLGGNYKIAARTEKNFLPGTKLTLKTGISGIATRAIVISSTYNPREKNYNITFLTESDLALSPKFYQDRHTSQFPGPKGDKGDSGIGIKSITEYYLATEASSGVTNETSGFTTSMQRLTSEKKYLWNYELITYTDLTTSKTNAVIIGVYGDKGQTGATGEKGDTGATGKGVKSITEYYLATANGSGITNATSGFTTTIQTVTSSKKYLWNYEKIIYTDNSESKTNAVIIGVYGDKGDTGPQGVKGDTGSKGDKGEQGVRGSLEFSGTEINAISDITEVQYTITTASTGITSATMPILVGDTYINVTTQDVWICSTAGTPTTAKWKYQGRRCSDKDDSNRFRMFTPATDNGRMETSLTKQVVKGENPFGKIDDLLKITNTNATTVSRYTPYNRRTKIDPKKTYRHVTYIKQEDANYKDFIGIASWADENTFCLSLSGSTINSAYFTSASNFGTLGRWYMVVGYIVANGTTTAPTDAGVYDMVTKQKVREVYNYQWKPNVTYCTNSGCYIRYTASASTKTGTAYLYDVRLDEVNGTEPTLNELLNLDTTTKSKGTWTASTIYNTGDIVYLNGNSYICTANHTSGTSFSTTNWNLIASKGADGKDGADGKNAITMTSATTPNGEYNGQIGIWQGQVYSWNGTSWVLTSGILPTDPVLHYSFDDLPDLPDGGNIVYAKNKNWTEITPFAGNATLSIENGCLVLDGKGVASYAYGRFGTHSNCYVKIKMSYDRDGVVCLYENVTSDLLLTNLNFEANEEKTVVLKLSDNNRVLGFSRFTGKITVKELYIGDASYTTPVIDNSGNNHNATDVKGLVTKGVSGKCFNFNGVNSSFVTQASSLGGEISFSFWIKLQNKGYTGTICQSRLVISEGFSIFYFNNLIRFDYGGKQSQFGKFVPEMEKLYHIVITQSATDKTLFVDGVKIQQIASSLTDAKYSKYMWFGLSGNNANKPTLSGNPLQGSLDDFQIFDRPLSDQEVLGLYLARGNTPKQYTKADYNIDQAPVLIPEITPKYLGAFNTVPTNPGKYCWFVAKEDFGDFKKGKLYKWTGYEWVCPDPKLSENQQMYMSALADILNTLQAGDDYFSTIFAKALIANQAFISNLQSQVITLTQALNADGTLNKNTGIIQSQNFLDTNGEEGWQIKANGSAVFKTGTFENIVIEKENTMKGAIIIDNDTRLGDSSTGYYSKGVCSKNFSYENATGFNLYTVGGTGYVRSDYINAKGFTRIKGYPVEMTGAFCFDFITKNDRVLYAQNEQGSKIINFFANNKVKNYTTFPFSTVCLRGYNETDDGAEEGIYECSKFQIYLNNNVVYVYEAKREFGYGNAYWNSVLFAEVTDSEITSPYFDYISEIAFFF